MVLYDVMLTLSAEKMQCMKPHIWRGGGQVSRSKNTVLVTRIVPLEIVMLGSGRQERSVRWAESSA